MTFCESVYNVMLTSGGVAAIAVINAMTSIRVDDRTPVTWPLITVPAAHPCVITHPQPEHASCEPGFSYDPSVYIVACLFHNDWILALLTSILFCVTTIYLLIDLIM